MATGTVKFFNNVKGLGIIKGDDGKDYSVHSSGVEAGLTIHEGDKVHFEKVDGERLPRANKVEKM